MSSYLRIVLLITVALLAGACQRTSARAPNPGLSELRRTAPTSDEPEVAAQWLLGELFFPQGDVKHTLLARRHLDENDRDVGMYGHLARGMDDWLHGRLSSTPEHFLQTAKAARNSTDPRAPFVAWLATHQAIALRNNSPGLWDRWGDSVLEMIEQPGNLGWRARGELVEFWSSEMESQAAPDMESKVAAKLGCLDAVRLAGPFGDGGKRDVVRYHAAAQPGPWPPRWKRAAGRGESPRILAADRHGCFVSADEPVADGMFYAETFIDLSADHEVLLAVQGALSVWVDDYLVLERDPRMWGEWARYGVQLWLRSGRHRIVARLDSPRTSVRLMQADGRPLRVKSSIDGAPPYSAIPPTKTGEPNLVSRFVSGGKTHGPADHLTRLLIAYLAYADGQADVASVLFEPFVEDLGDATGPALVLSTLFTEGDPVFPEGQTRDLARELQQRSVEKDSALWQSRLALALWDAEQEGATKAIEPVRKLVQQFPEVPAVSLAAAELYARLGWQAEYSNAVKELAERFPDSVKALQLAIDVYEDEGSRDIVDKLVARIQRLDPDSEIVLTRALEREDYATALAELERLGERRPERKDIAKRIHAVLARAGDRQETWKQLRAAVEEEPRDGRARLELADAQLASGKPNALSRALIGAVEAGASTDQLEQALDLVEGITELEPYRLRAEPIIAAYEASGVHLPGHAARVLDYMAVWVKSDGSSRMLEHEIVRIQSAEAITKMAEHRRLEGLPLHMRVIKQDGRVLEPEFVAGKPTVTFPHLEVGDYIETEHIMSTPGDGAHGVSYVGPHWFFREENVAYARSEFVVISPAAKSLIVETAGQVPEPQREDHSGLEVRRWRVDQSPAAPNEPNSPPINEFLPSVRVGWGVSQAQQLRRFYDAAIDLTPVDPRIVRIAERIVEPTPASDQRGRALKLYRWVLANVEDGEENDGRRVVIGKEGSRARGFETLCRALGIDVDYAVARSKLTAPPRGPLTRAVLFDQLVLRVGGSSQPTWLTVGSKYAPFGYVPAEVRGMPAYLMSGTKPKRVHIPAAGSRDGIDYEGKVVLAPNGSAKLELVQRFLGRHAMAARRDLSKLSQRRIPDVLQALIAQSLRGATLLDHEVEHLEDLDSPLAIKMVVRMREFAQPRGKSLVIQPPFPSLVTNLTALPERQTPLLVPFATYRHVKLRVVLPQGAKLESRLTPGEIDHGENRVVVQDHLEHGVLVLERTVSIPAGRVQPEEYADFLQFARRADEAQTTSIRVSLQ